MRPLPITALTAVSAMGHGAEATLAALRSRRGGLRPCDFEGIARGWIGRVEGVEAEALPPGFAAYDCRNNRLAEIALRQDGFADAVGRARAAYGAARVAVVLGTSTAGVLAGEHAYRRRGPDGALPDAFDHEHTQDLFSLARYVRGRLGLRGPAMVVSNACASGARSFADAHDLIAAGVCDAAVVGGADSLCGMTLRGFAALDLVADGPCRPLDADRAGVSIGEAAAFALLERDGEGDLALLGHGATSDGHHMSAPDPAGAGAAGAMRRALDRAGLAPAAIDYVNLHGTGTRANDAMEDVAVAAVFGTDTPCSSTKGWSGHTLGASGALEALVAGLCVRHGLRPGCLGVERPDPALRARVLLDNEAGEVRRVMSNSFGFGGTNCSLVIGRPG